MNTKVYIETSIFSFYYDQRSAPAAIAMRDWTRTWWDDCREEYAIATSTAVLAELDSGSLPHRAKSYDMALSIPAVSVEDAVGEIVEVYIEHRVMPQDPLGDALHLALASFHKFDFLLTWNCKHLANANKFDHIRRINTLMGLRTPNLITPLELLDIED